MLNTSSLDSSASPEATGLPRLPDLSPEQWGQLGAGAALALVGSGVLSLGTVVRLAAIVGGAAIAYRVWTSASGSAPVAGADASVDTVGSPLPTASSLPSAMPLPQTGLGTSSDFPDDPGVDLAPGGAPETGRGA